jgi:preprotein translocase subunit SecE
MSSQSFIGYAILVVFSLIIFGMSGYVVDLLIPWGNRFLIGYAQSQDSLNTVHLLLQILVSSPFISLLLIGYDHINNSNSQSGGDR